MAVGAGPGVIGAKPIHLQEDGEEEHTIPLDALRIDLGPGGDSKAKVGDRATFATTFRQVGPSLMGKALDNRLGVATVIELFKNAPDNIELMAAFTVQEEIGLRGDRAGTFPFAANGRAKGLGDQRGLVKFLADAKTDRILGVHMIGPHVTDMISEGMLLTNWEATADDLARLIHPHPTLGETIGMAAEVAHGSCTDLPTMKKR